MLNVDRFHLVGAKLGGTVARRFAARYPERVSTLTVAGTPPPQREGIAATHPALVKEYEAEGGVAHWANRTMAGRLGSRFAPEGAHWWINLMGQTAASTMTGVSTHVSPTDISADLPRITCPTLVMAGDNDPITPRAFSETIVASLPPALVRFERFSDCGHGIVRDAPERHFEVLREFISA